ncbi:hypothetical protein PYCH_09710 [Pyrococcus yayanosii CH1]|uniref:Uncharacterized protein n=1 Tax=Pyrococcus yayanosii (strain CH1 / JCM 16557) TaxID=529709 RepID=F8AJ45_PYRYC|nr:hypothetical protein PYCH_09710 [Pyrococcus yayanosii CH1]
MKKCFQFSLSLIGTFLLNPSLTKSPCFQFSLSLIGTSILSAIRRL